VVINQAVLVRLVKVITVELETTMATVLVVVVDMAVLVTMVELVQAHLFGYLEL
jgi:hypothetical protein